MPTDSTETTPAIVADNVSVTFDNRHHALAGMSCIVERGEFVSIVGPSGCGKSTWLRLVAGLQTATAGSVTVDGVAPRAADNKIGFVFQQPTLLPWRVAGDNIGLPLELAGVSREVRQVRIEASGKMVGLAAADMSKLPRMLSGGMQMRVSVARALVTEPDVMLLDEPFAALDDLLRGQLNEELVRLWQQQRWTTLFVTHNVGEAVLLSQRVLVMSQAPGRIVAELPIDLPYPRSVSMRGRAAFAGLVGEVTRALSEVA